MLVADERHAPPFKVDVLGLNVSCLAARVAQGHRDLDRLVVLSTHLGTAMSCRIFSMTSLMARPSISNSGRRMRRCSRTGTAMVLMSSGVTKSRAWRAAWARLARRRAGGARGPGPT